MASRQRTSAEQFAALVEFMERHGDIMRPQQGPQGRIRADRLWQECATLLNSIGGGVQRTSEKWKKVWADWKAKTKVKAMQIRQHTSGTGGGPKSKLSLTDLEERVLGVIGLSAIDGQAGIEEQGLNSLQQPTPPTFAGPSTSQQSGFIIEVVDQSAGGIEHASSLQPDPQNLIAPPHPEPSEPVARPFSPPERQPPPPAAVSPLPSSVHSSPRRRQPMTARRRRLQTTPFERACSEFAAIEQRRLQREEAQERRLHEREMERLRLEAERIEVAREHNQMLHRLADIAQLILQLLNNRN